MKDDLQSGTTASTRWAGLSATGSKRDSNEDAFAVFAAREIFAIADGCGGSDSDRRAADITLACFGDDGGAAHLLEPKPSSPYRTPPRRRELLGPPADSLAQAAVLANELVFTDALLDPRRRGQGATLAALRLQPGWMTTVHVGDCRIARFRENRLEWLTTDHTLLVDLRKTAAPADEIRRAEELHSTVITRALGYNTPLDVELQYFCTRPADTYLICSDGLWRQVSLVTISGIIDQPSASLTTQCRALIEAAEEAGGTDNTTAVLLEII